MNNKERKGGGGVREREKKNRNYWHGKVFWVRWKREKKLHRNDGVILSKLFFTLELLIMQFM
jgi:hypothetical protein